MGLLGKCRNFESHAPSQNRLSSLLLFVLLQPPPPPLSSWSRRFHQSLFPPPLQFPNSTLLHIYAEHVYKRHFPCTTRTNMNYITLVALFLFLTMPQANSANKFVRVRPSIKLTSVCLTVSSAIALRTTSCQDVMLFHGCVFILDAL